MSELHAFVLELGRSLSLAGTAVSETQERLTAVAAASGEPDARVVVLPTALMIAFGRAGSATIESIPQLAGGLRLDEISALYDLLSEAERGSVEPAEGLRRLQSIRTMTPRHGVVVALLSYTAMTVGLCLVLQPTPGDVAISAGLGALVGVFVLAARGRRTLTVLVPVLSAMVVSTLTFEAVKHGAADPGLRALIAPLVTFLPGGVLTTATVELASGEMVAGPRQPGELAAGDRSGATRAAGRPPGSHVTVCCGSAQRTDASACIELPHDQEPPVGLDLGQTLEVADPPDPDIQPQQVRLDRHVAADHPSSNADRRPPRHDPRSDPDVDLRRHDQARLARDGGLRGRALMWSPVVDDIPYLRCRIAPVEHG